MPAQVGVLTIEYKVNFLAPAAGERFVARGRVTKPGRNVTVCTGDVVAIQEGRETLIATMLTTMMVVRDRPAILD
jgi:acyl-coenzyme A thioesterase PaaI-like protein